MPGKTRLVSAPQARGNSANGSWRQLKDSMGAILPNDGEPELGSAPEKFETALVPDDAWERTVASREAAEGIARLAQTQHPPYPTASYSEGSRALDEVPHHRQPMVTDLTSLPNKFQLDIERKNDRWKVTAPGVHSGLWKSGIDLPEIVEEALAVLAEMVRLDGAVPAAKRGRKTK